MQGVTITDIIEMSYGYGVWLGAFSMTEPIRETSNVGLQFSEKTEEFLARLSHA